MMKITNLMGEVFEVDASTVENSIEFTKAIVAAADAATDCDINVIIPHGDDAHMVINLRSILGAMTLARELDHPFYIQIIGGTAHYEADHMKKVIAQFLKK